MPRQNELWRNRKERKEWARRLQSDDPSLEVMPGAPGFPAFSVPHNNARECPILSRKLAVGFSASGKGGR
jgi:hypothetical protein